MTATCSWLPGTLNSGLPECRGGPQIAIVKLPGLWGVHRRGVHHQIARVDDERHGGGPCRQPLGELPQQVVAADMGVGDLDKTEIGRLGTSHQAKILDLPTVAPAPERRRGPMIARQRDPHQGAALARVQAVAAFGVGRRHADAVADQHARDARLTLHPTGRSGWHRHTPAPRRGRLGRCSFRVPKGSRLARRQCTVS